MFTHHLAANDDSLLQIDFSDFAKRHFLNKFERKYRGKQWEITLDSIIQDLSRLRTSSSGLQRSTQIDELYGNGHCWIFKYDFRIAGQRESAKAAGNRVVGFLDADAGRIEVLFVYNKNDLPKNCKETAFIMKILDSKFSDFLEVAK